MKIIEQFAARERKKRALRVREVLMKINNILFIFIFFIISSNAFCAQINLDKEIKSIPSMVSDIFCCGNWQYEGQTGFYRVIYIEFYYGCSLLYIQWMLDRDIKDGHTKIMHTLSIKEFNADDHIEFTYNKPECEKTKNGIKLKIVTDPWHDNKKRKIEVDVFHKFGKYSFSEQVIQ